MAAIALSVAVDTPPQLFTSAIGCAVRALDLATSTRLGSVPLWRTTAAMLREWLRHLQDAGSQGYLLPSSAGRRLSCSSVTQRLALAVAQAACKLPALAERAVSPHTIRHTTAMHLLQSGVDITVIALWLGHEHPSTTHIYMEADLAMKEAALSRLQPIAAAPARYSPPDQLMAFLQSL